jgi:serine/threonine-protein kinase
MEWIDGESLVTLLGDCERSGLRIPFAAAAQIGADAARGLHAAHELKDEGGELVGVVHRDVSPHNILVTYDGVVKIVDFGVAKAVARGDHQATNAGHLKGKVHFMAPEQAYCDEVDRRTDVFALGIVLYQLTTGHHPFRADNELATLARITSPEPVPAPSMHVADYPVELADVLLKALAKEPDQRFATMRDLADALDAVASKLGGAAGSPGMEAFVHEALDARKDARAAQIKDARRAADAREGHRAADATATPLPAVVVPAGPTSEDSSGALASSPAVVPARRGGALARAIGLVSLGAVLGAVALIWATRGTPAPEGSASSLAATLAPLPLASASAAAVIAAPPPSVEPVASVGQKTSAPPPSVSASSAPIATARPAVKSPPVVPRAPKGDAAGKFRNPGF